MMQTLLLFSFIVISTFLSNGQLVDRTCHTMLNFGGAAYRRDAEGALVKAYPDGRWLYKNEFLSAGLYEHEQRGYSLIYDASKERWDVKKDGMSFMFCEQEHLWDCWEDTWYYINGTGQWDGPHPKADIVPWCYEMSIDCSNYGIYGDAVCISDVIEGLNVTQWQLYSEGCVNNMPMYYHYVHEIDGEEYIYNLHYCDYQDMNERWIITKNGEKVAVCNSVDLMECGHGSWYKYDDSDEDQGEGEDVMYPEISVSVCTSSDDLSSNNLLSSTLPPESIIGLSIGLMIMVVLATVCIWARSKAKIERNEVKSLMTSVNQTYEVESY